MRGINLFHLTLRRKSINAFSIRSRCSIANSPPGSALLCSRQSVGWRRERKRERSAHLKPRTQRPPSVFVIRSYSRPPPTPSDVATGERSGPGWTPNTKGPRRASSRLIPASHHPRPPYKIRRACPLCLLSQKLVSFAGEALITTPALVTGPSSSLLYIQISLFHLSCTWKCLCYSAFCSLPTKKTKNGRVKC